MDSQIILTGFVMFYSKIVALSKERGTNISNVISELQLSSGNLSKWKAGGMPKADTISKLADYFHGSTDYLLGRTDDPAPVGEGKEPAESGAVCPPEYDLLDPEDRALIHSMIRRLILEKNQGDASSPSNGAGSETA